MMGPFRIRYVLDGLTFKVYRRTVFEEIPRFFWQPLIVMIFPKLLRPTCGVRSLCRGSGTYSLCCILKLCFFDVDAGTAS